MIHFKIVILFTIFTAICVQADLFTSMADLQRLLQIEKDLPKVVENYITSENARLDELKR